MREEKLFRAWDDKTSQWMYTTPSSYKWNNVDLSYGFSKDKDYARFLLNESQFTSLKDKNNKKIFEGDIMTNKEGDVDYIYWEETYWAFKLVTTGFSRLRIYDWDWEVIGNIHENPELLTANK